MHCHSNRCLSCFSFLLLKIHLKLFDFYSKKYHCRKFLRLGTTNTTIDRKCQKEYQYVDKMEFNEFVQEAQESFCVTDTVIDDDGAIFNEIECYCYSDQCNSQWYDNNWPQPQLTSRMTVDCKSEICTAAGCQNIGPNGICKGQYCFRGNKMMSLKKINKRYAKILDQVDYARGSTASGVIIWFHSKNTELHRNLYFFH